MARDYEPDRRGMAAIMRGREMQDMSLSVARDLVPDVRRGTPRDTGQTAADTHAVEDRLPDGTAGAAIVQGGASVQQNFGNQRTRAQHHLPAALGNGG